MSSHCDFESVNGQAVKLLFMSLFKAVCQCQSSTSVLLIITSKYSNSCESFSGQESYTNDHFIRGFDWALNPAICVLWECVHSELRGLLFLQLVISSQRLPCGERWRYIQSLIQKCLLSLLFPKQLQCPSIRVKVLYCSTMQLFKSNVFLHQTCCT